MSAAWAAAAAVVLAGAALRPAPPRREHSNPGCRDAPDAHPLATRRRWPRRPARHGACGPDEVARWCTDLARAVRSGSTLAAALRATAAPVGAHRAIAELHLALDRGTGLAAALDHVASASSSADLRLACTVLQACAANGGPPGEPLDRAAATLRARAADWADRRTHSAQARMSALAMTWLPVAMLLLLLVTSAPVRAIATTPLGALTIVAGALLNAAGWRWMTHIIGRSR